HSPFRETSFIDDRYAAVVQFATQEEAIAQALQSHTCNQPEDCSRQSSGQNSSDHDAATDKPRDKINDCYRFEVLKTVEGSSDSSVQYAEKQQPATEAHQWADLRRRQS